MVTFLSELAASGPPLWGSLAVCYHERLERARPRFLYVRR